MSNLVKPYEISVWDDIWDSDKGKFIEKKLLVIGTDEMTSLNRALEPVLTRNVNGTKKFSFKMYKRYIDRETGEEVHNLFIDYLINERKIKLKYGVDDEGNDKWYDFIIKNINETSITYLYQFDLEDAIVQELSKNGFGVTLDAQLKNNMGTADELAEKVLADTNWQVSGSDKLVQEVKEHLVYVSAPTTLQAWALKNSGANYDQEGVIEDFTTLNTTGKTILAFYSSCTGKPHRFQFIILPDYIEINEDNVIINKDCQYFVEYNPEDYTVENKDYGFKLPTGWSIPDQGDVETNDKDTIVSYKYRGNRFGYAPQAVYLPKLDRYVNKYTNSSYKNEDGTSKIIYGYIDNEYISPVLMTNLISNTDFKNTSGWKGVGYTNESTLSKKPTAENKPVVENVYGRFDGDNFISATTDLTNGAFSDTQTYEAYMKLDFSQTKTIPGVTPIVINRGPFDNRTLINKIINGDEWALYVEDRTGNWPTGLTFTLEEVIYDSVTGCYKQTNSGKISFTSSTTFSPQIFTFGECDYSDKTFKKNVKLHLKITGSGTHYIKTIELHKVVRDKDKNIIRLNAQADKIDEGIVNTKYFYFTEEAYDAATTKDEIKYIHTADKAEPSTYEPVYNAGAEKIRSVTAKESNYFNILQSIAETFEAWLDLKIIRDTNGTVIGKQVSFKKYSGGDNYAAFRYGVNLKDITRTIESKQIVTKLIVKNNSNELAPSKFCTIQRAPSNVSGENYIYDFQYYHNNGLLDANNYLNELYYTAGALGKDVDINSTETNIKGYFPRLKALNNKLVDINDKMSGLSQELLQLKAEREVAEATYEAAEFGIEQTSEDFETLTGFSIDAYNIEDISTTIGYDRVDSFEIPQTIDENSKHKLVYNIQPDENGPLYLISPTITREANGQYKLSCTAIRSWLQQDGGIGTYKIIKATYYICASIGGKYKYIAQNIKVEFKGFSDKKTTQESEKISDAIITSVDVTRSDVNKLLTEYLSYQKEKKSSGDEKDRLTALIDGTVKLDENNKPILENGELKRNDDGKQKQYDILKQEFENIRDNQKLPLNQAFFQKYSRFIQEGTWIDEQYVDDEKYYNDAQTVLYNSCYPKVGYTINVLSLSKMPGYELFVFDVGEKTYAEDEEFFGTDENGYPNRTEIIITEMSEHLDNPSADSIKVQNFKNQFQDLFQKITATVQQTQYNEGTYRKGAALVEASNEKKNEFLLDSLSDPASVLSNAGQNEVVWDNAGITVTNKNNRSEQLRLVSSGIMFSTDSESGPKWSTGITPQGISANKILAGSINTGEISLMNGKDTSFLWNVFGINAFDYEIENGTVTSVNKSKFVRFDRNGIYGINGEANADAWKPNSLNEVDEKATFALTWEGLKITGNNGVVARIGKVDDKIISITNQGNNIFSITNNGHASLSGSVVISGSTSTDDTGVTLDNISTGTKSQYGYSSSENGNITWADNGTPEGYNSAIHYLWQRFITSYTAKADDISAPSIISYPTSRYTVEVSNENILLPTDSTGDLAGDFSSENELLKNLTTITAHLYDGNNEITEGVEYNWSFIGAESAYTLHIIGLGKQTIYLQLSEGQTSSKIPDSVQITLSVKYTNTIGGFINFNDKIINITKVKGGAPGEYATVYEIRPESAAINISEWNYSENTFSVEVYKIQDTSEKFTLTSDSDPYLDVQGGIITYDSGVAKIKLEQGSEKLNLYLKRSNNQSVLDYETVSFIKNGENGKNGGIAIEYGFYQAFSQIPKFPDLPIISNAGAINKLNNWVLVEKYPNDLAGVSVSSQPDTSINQPYLYKYTWTKYIDGNINTSAIIKVGEHPSVFGETYQEVLFLRQKDTSLNLNNTPLPEPPSIPEDNKVKPDTWYKVANGASLPVTVIFDGNTVEEKPLRYTRTVQRYAYPKDKITATKPVLDMAIQNVVDWCNINNSTLIDGGNIYAGSISAGLMNTNAIRSLNYKAYADSKLISTTENGKVIDPEENLIPYIINQENQEVPTFAYQGTFLDLANGNIYSKNFRIVDGNAYFRGYIEANGGKIGGWYLYDNILSSGDNEWGNIFLSPTGKSVNNKSIVFKAGNDFMVSENGEMYASAGEIGGFTITNASLYSWDESHDSTMAGIGLYGSYQAFWAGASAENSHLAPFHVSHEGELFAKKGQVGGWYLTEYGLRGTSSSPTDWRRVELTPSSLQFNTTTLKENSFTFRYNTDATNNPSFDSINQLKVAYDYFSISVDTSPNGVIDQTNTYLGIPDLIIKGDWFKIPMPDQIISGAHINFFAFDIVGNWKNNHASFNGNWILPSSAAMYATSGDIGTGSDKRIKSNITILTNEYSQFFDGLQPSFYEYLDGTSHRKHCGFIAQDVVLALKKANLTTQDFAGVMLKNPGEESECWFLRYSEFIALNTDQIQKLKPRVSTLEQTILNYESRISNLETEIQNLKYSQNSDII